MANSEKNKWWQSSGLWVIIVAAVVLESISCIQYFTNRAAVKYEAELRAKTELRKAELEIEMHTIELETAAKALALLVEKHVDCPDSVYSATRLAVSTLRANTSLAVAYVPNYFPKMRLFEACSSKISEDSIYTRQIGSEDHDYTQMEWYQNGFVRDSCWWSEPYLDDSGSQTYVVSCSYPIHDRKGKVVAIVCVDMSLADLKNISDYLQVYPNSYYSIQSSKGVDMVPVPDTIAGRKYCIYHEEINATGWHLEIIIPEDVLFADMNRIGLFVGILMLIGLALLLFIVWHAGKSNRDLLLSTAKNERMENELHIARTIQMAMLPKVFPPFNDRLDLNIYGFVTPAKEVGGDLYDFYVRHDKLFFCIGDVSGKGVPASLVMVMTRSLFRSVSALQEDAATIVTEMNKALCDQNSENMFLTLFLGVLDCKTGKLTYCNAGHNAPLYLRFDDEQFTIEALPVKANLPLGIEPTFPFQAQTIQIHHNDLLFLYTDGLSEAENTAHAQFGEQRILQSLAELKDSRPRAVIDQMLTHVEAFVDGAEQSDDLTMLGIRYQNAAIVMRNDIQQIPTLAEWIEDLGIPPELDMPINLALEEVVTNVMLYAYPKSHGQVLVEFTRINSSTLIFTVSDSGIAFDPTQQQEADITLSAEERQIGGLGIHLVKQLMDTVEYERKDEKNILTLTKCLNG